MMLFDGFILRFRGYNSESMLAKHDQRIFKGENHIENKCSTKFAIVSLSGLSLPCVETSF